MLLKDKYDQLKSYLAQKQNIMIAFSGGVDSTFLLYAAKDAGATVHAVTIKSVFQPAHELQDTIDFSKQIGVLHEIIDVDVLAIPQVKENPSNRCYICKTAIFGVLREKADAIGAVLCDGSNLDDTKDYRPGMVALKELGVASPLLELGWTKAEIVQMSKELMLPTANKPAIACLATRFEAGTVITEEGLKKIDSAEQFLREIGFGQLRVRSHGDVARIELPGDMIIVAAQKANEIAEGIKRCGFRFVSLDLSGYKMGSMNKIN